LQEGVETGQTPITIFVADCCGGSGVIDEYIS